MVVAEQQVNENKIDEPSQSECITLGQCVAKAIGSYLDAIKNHQPSNLYELILQQIEVPLLGQAMQYTGNNQSRMAILLGLSRGTLRKKLSAYGFIPKIQQRSTRKA